MTKKRNPDTSVIINGYDAQGRAENLTAKECDAIAKVFLAAAKAIREGKHGTITCQPEGYDCILAEVGIDQGEDFPFDNGLPVLERISL